MWIAIIWINSIEVFWFAIQTKWYGKYGKHDFLLLLYRVGAQFYGSQSIWTDPMAITFVTE
jgi:hypothetical protein